MFWLYLLGAVTVLTIALRRVLKRQKPLGDELYAKSIAIDYVQSGVAWVRADGTFGSVNQSFARTFAVPAPDLIGREWYKIFPASRHQAIRDIYSQMLLMGTVNFDSPGETAGGAPLWLNVRLVAVHDHQARFVGHHCLVEDDTRLHQIEQSLSAEEQKSQRLEAPAGRSR